VAPLAVLAELTLPFCKIGGCFIAQKKGDIREEITGSTKAIDTLGGKLNDKIDVELDEFNDGRYLVVFEKIRETPLKYPRRSGIPAKRPLS
ncbi:MAG: 16S rRNA (guanine(527)-N(7))-methyltransferase RsmG, partial [Dehalococcoidia bacterium]|jgi:16S rRNA (guanine527-N7)-methyltransferase